MKQLPLAKLHHAAMATFRSYQSWEVPATYVNVEAEYQDIAHSVAVVDFSFFTLIRVTGADRADYLNRRLSQLVLDMREGDGRRAGLLDGLGRMQADVEVFADSGSFLILSPPREGDSLAAELDKYVFTEDCQFEDVTGNYIVVAVVGPMLQALMEAHNAEPLGPGQRIAPRVFDNTDTRLLQSQFIPGGLLMVGKASELHALMGRVVKAVEDFGGHLAGFDAFDAWRVVHGWPWWGRDLDNETIPLEADLASAIHFDKGCYPGQETIARITNLGHPARKLVRLAGEADAPFKTGAPLYASDGRRAGRITSSAVHPEEKKWYALAMVKWPFKDAGTELAAREDHRENLVHVLGPCARAY